MTRIAGINIPTNKKVFVGLTEIFGIGFSTAHRICKETGVDPNKRVNELSEGEVLKLRECIDSNFVIEGDLKKTIAMRIKGLKDIKSYKGSRHINGLPCRGQRTRTNARTRKGKSSPIAGKKKAAKK